MPLVLADAAIIAGGFADSLGQLFTSPWIIPVAVFAVMLAALLVLRGRTRRLPLQPLPPDEVIDDALPMFFERREEADGRG